MSLTFTFEVIGRARGETLEIAAGTGRNLSYYPAEVSLTLTDRSENMLKELAKKHKDVKGNEVLPLVLRSFRGSSSSQSYVLTN